jgi:hypothetical protein
MAFTLQPSPLLMEAFLRKAKECRICGSKPIIYDMDYARGKHLGCKNNCQRPIDNVIQIDGKLDKYYDNMLTMVDKWNEKNP